MYFVANKCDKLTKGVFLKSGLYSEQCGDAGKLKKYSIYSLSAHPFGNRILHFSQAEAYAYIDIVTVACVISEHFTSAQLRENGVQLSNNRRMEPPKSKSAKPKLWVAGHLQNDRKHIHEKLEKYKSAIDNDMESIASNATFRRFDQEAFLQPLRRSNYYSRLLKNMSKMYPSDEMKENIKLLPDLRKYFNLRYFYQGNSEYEVGYLVNEIITRYQTMLEVFSIAQNRWYKHQDKNFINSNFMLYLYTNVLTIGKVIAHLPMVEFADWDTDNEFEAFVDEYEKQLRDHKKKRRRKHRKKRLENLYIGYIPTPPDRRPNRSASRWPLEYGWSIELDW
ncbi:hypothetical protein HF086_018271 [Spodoptera exigua]|uniref:Uncharacterized protein n=1 Tax=Spodoptera exigua TaxID=7107 RepID=A0A922SQ91_SPOEX|nr:hypothetical protein HF086_018271 [Spodoptera exigua]